MHPNHPIRLIVIALTLASTAALGAKPRNDTRWVGTWAASPYALANTDNTFAAEPTTLRQTVHVSVGGPSFRVTLSNEFGAEDLTLGGASVSIAAASAPVPLTFNGQPGITVPAGAAIVSDPVATALPALSDLTINLYLPPQTLKTITFHNSAYTTGYEARGNQLTATDLPGAKKVYIWRFLKTVEVASKSPAAIVAFGDSITDGAKSTRDTNARWPDELARRLQADPHTRSLGVLNEGIGGNRVLHDGTAPNALARFDRDVLAQPGVKYVIFMESINDIGHAAQLDHPYDIVSADDLIAGIKQLILRAHTHGLTIYGATLTPYEGAGYASPAGEIMRQAVNTFIRSGAFDGVIDFDKAVRDPAHPAVSLPLYDSGDHLHPSDAGYKVMGDFIDLKLFRK